MFRCNTITCAWWVTVLASCNAFSTMQMSAQNCQDSLNRRTFFKSSITLAGAGLISTSTSTLGSQPSFAAQLTEPPSVGTKAPDFTLPNSKGDGSTTSLDSLTKNKKWTVLYFYPGAFTTGCTLEAKGFQKDIDKYRELNAQIVGGKSPLNYARFSINS